MHNFLEARLGGLVAANIGAAGISNVVANLEPIMHFLVASGQIAVAVVTVLYIVRKIKNLPKKTKKDEEA